MQIPEQAGCQGSLDGSGEVALLLVGLAWGVDLPQELPPSSVEHASCNFSAQRS